MATETMMNNINWPTLNETLSNCAKTPNHSNEESEAVIPPFTVISPKHDSEWEMIADVEEEEHCDSGANPIIILPTVSKDSNGDSQKKNGRPRSATVGGEVAKDGVSGENSSHGGGSTISGSSSKNDVPKINPRILRRCASTPDLGNDRDVIVEEESLDDDGNIDYDKDEEKEEESSEDVELIEAESVEDAVQQGGDMGQGYYETPGDSFELLFHKNQGLENNAKVGKEEEAEEEPVLVDEDDEEEEGESATLVSTPSMDTSGWTMASSANLANPSTSIWGGVRSPSFKDILSKNSSNNTGGGHSLNWKDKAQVEAMLRDSHCRHRLRVRTKPKFIVMEEGGGAVVSTVGGMTGGKMMKHAHSTGDLTNLLEGVEEERMRTFGQGRSRKIKQFSSVMEEDEEGDVYIGSGGGGCSSIGGGGGDGDILGETDAMDYYHRKEKGSTSTYNKKKERPDEAKRKEISMYKKELQKKKQSEKGGGDSVARGKKKKSDKVFGGKKDRQFLR